MGFRSRLKGMVGKLVGGEPPERAAPRAATAAPDDNAVNLATIECGAQELKERLDCGEEIVIVDVRTKEELASGGLPGARHIPLQELEARWRELEDADEIVCYCARGARSLKAAELLRAKGLINATSLEGGLPAWTSAGGETTSV